METKFRSLNLEDKDSFLATLSALSTVIISESSFKEIFDARRTLGVITIVAEIENEVVGTASYFIEPKFLHQGGKVMHIQDVAVKHEMQGKGIGKACVEYLEYLAKLQGCYKVILDCDEKNVSFYEKCGFKRHEIEMRKDLLRN